MKRTLGSGLKIVFGVSVVGALILAAGCGGGTTGTSSTGELRFQGRAEKARGTPLADTDMTVFSTASSRELLATRTDSQGGFRMSLPAEERGVYVEIDGIKTPDLRREFSGTGVLVTAVMQQSVADERNGKGVPGAKRRFFNVQYTFELQLDEASLCSALSTNNNQIVLDGQVDGDVCPVTIKGSSQDVPNDSFYAQLIGECDGSTMPLTLVKADQSGSMTVDIAEALLRECRSLRISAYSVQVSDTRIEFPIIRP